MLCHSLEIEDDSEILSTNVSTPVRTNPNFKSDQPPFKDIDLEGGEAISASEQDSILIDELDPTKATPPPQDMKPKGKDKDHPGINLRKLALGKRWTGLSGFGGAVGVAQIVLAFY